MNEQEDKLRKKRNPDAHWPISIVGAFAGMLVGTLPSSIWALVFDASFSPLYAFVPLCVYFGIRLFRGFTGKRGFILTMIFSLVGLYLAALSSLAVEDILHYGMSVFYLPLVTIAMIGKGGLLSSSVISSANIFPIIFMAIGAAVSYELLMKDGKLVLQADNAPAQDESK